MRSSGQISRAFKSSIWPSNFNVTPEILFSKLNYVTDGINVSRRFLPGRQMGRLDLTPQCNTNFDYCRCQESERFQSVFKAKPFCVDYPLCEPRNKLLGNYRAKRIPEKNGTQKSPPSKKPTSFNSLLRKCIYSISNDRLFRH